MKKLLMLVLALVLYATSFAQVLLNPQEPVKLDPNVRVGKLDNGLTYYIRHNEMPDNRADFYIATNVGAINETPAQRGLAHFLEHMCFNGNKDFPGNTMLPYLEKNGLTFGGNINAMTGVEQTIYTFYDVPTDRKGLVDTLLLILQNDAAFVTNDFAEIEKERGVIIEEWRSGNSAQRRGQEEFFKVLYKGTKYATCNVIGDEQGLLSFDPQELVNFYKTWYFPANQAIVVVGDIDVDYIEGKIKELFSIIPKKENPPVKEVIAIPENETTEVCVFTDPEIFATNVALFMKGEALPKEYNAYGIGVLTDLMKSIMSNIINERLTDASKEADSKFTYASFGFSNLTETTDATQIVALPKDNSKGLEALTAAVEIVRQASQYGFTEAEYERAKTQILRSYQSAIDNAQSRRNGQFAMAYVNHFLDNQPYTEPQYIKDVVEGYFNLLNVSQINQAMVASGFVSEKNSVIYYVAPQKEGVQVPSVQEVKDAYKSALTSEVKEMVSNEITEPLIDPSKIKAGKIKKEETGFLGAKVITLSNGITAYLYPTDVSKDRVSIELAQKGGLSIVPESLLPVFESNIRSVYSDELGVANFTSSQLEKVLTGKRAYASPYVGSFASGVSGGGSSKDIETIFQLLYLQYTQPRCEDAEFNNSLAQIRLLIDNLDSNPQIKFSKMVNKAMSNNHPRSLFIDKELLEKATADKVRESNKLFLGDAVGAKLFLVGDFEIDQVKPLLEKYIASLPVKSKKEKEIVNHKILPKKGVFDVIESTAMQNPNTFTSVVYTGDAEYNAENRLLYSAYGYIMRMRYTESLREEDGGTYSPSANASVSDRLNNVFTFSVVYQTQLEKSPELLRKTYAEVDKIAAEGPTDEEITKTVEMFKKTISENEKELSYWEGLIYNYYFWNDGDTRRTQQMIENTITKENIKKIAQKVKNSGNRINITLNPEK